MYALPTLKERYTIVQSIFAPDVSIRWFQTVIPSNARNRLFLESVPACVS